MFLDKFAEEGDGGELQLHHYLLDAFLRAHEEAFHILHHVAVDELRGRMPAVLLANGAEVLGCYVEVGCVPLDGARTRIGLDEQVGKLLENIVARGVTRHPHRQTASQGIVKLVHEGLEQQGDD